jgi:hypothetical protein
MFPQRIHLIILQDKYNAKVFGDYITRLRTGRLINKDIANESVKMD